MRFDGIKSVLSLCMQLCILWNGGGRVYPVAAGLRVVQLWDLYILYMCVCVCVCVICVCVCVICTGGNASM